MEDTTKNEVPEGRLRNLERTDSETVQKLAERVSVAQNVLPHYSAEQTSVRLATWEELATSRLKGGSIKTTNSSPTDPAYIPHTGKELDTNMLSTIQQADTVFSAAERTSFFELSSDSDTSADEDNHQVVRRANSVRMTKPNIVQHKRFTPELTAALVDEDHEDGEKLNMQLSRGALEDVKQESLSDRMHGDEAIITQTRKSFASAMSGLTQNPPSRTSTLHSSSPTQAQPETRDLRMQGDTIPFASTFDSGSTEYNFSRLSRSVTSPLPRNRDRKHVTISPLNIDTTRHNADFRESIVSTPYPSTGSDNQHTANFQPSLDFQGGKATAQHSGFLRKRIIRQRSEVLFLDLGLAKHPCARTTLEIQILDNQTFDDEALFLQIRRAYFRQLLGMSRLPFALVCVVVNATAVIPVTINKSSFNTSDFLYHFQNPRIGRRSKAWIRWLRNHNSRYSSHNVQSLSNTKDMPVQKEERDTHTVTQALQQMKVELACSGGESTEAKTSNEKTINTNETAKDTIAQTKKKFSVGSLSTKLPGIRLMYNLGLQTSNKHSSCQSYFQKSSSNLESPRMVTISLHHRLSFSMIAFLTACTLFWSISATIL